MNPIVKYTLGRVGLFVALLAVMLLIPYPPNFFVKAMIALFASAGLSYVLLGRWRTEMAEQLASVAERRRAEKTRLRAALSGDEEAASQGDRAAPGERATQGDLAAGPAAGQAKPVDGPAA